MALALTAQAVAAYLPGWLWRGWEGGSLAAVVGDSGMKALDDILAETSEQCGARADTVADKVVSLAGTHNKWTACFLLCEILNFGVTIGQIFFTDFFLGGFFISYGLDMINHVIEKDFEDENPMEKVVFNKSLYEVDQYIQIICILLPTDVPHRDLVHAAQPGRGRRGVAGEVLVRNVTRDT